MFGSQWYVIGMVMAPIVGLVGTAFGAILTYRANRRAASGTIETSDARLIWEQAQKIIAELRTEVTRLTGEVDRLGKANERLDAEKDELRETVNKLTAEVDHLRARLPA